MIRRRIFSLAVSAVLAAVPTALSADTATFSLAPPVTASSSSPFTGCSFGTTDDGVVYADTEVEPFVAVNPTDPNNIIGVYQQDRWSDGGAHGLVASYSDDGGTTWSRSYAGFSKCADNASPFNRSSDPWVSFDSAGRAYQISLGVDSVDFNLSGIEVATSTDGGANWSAPAQLIVDDNPVEFNDKESITADWRPGVGAGKAYATWVRGALPGWDHLGATGAANSFAYAGLPMFSRTEDGGLTWSTPTPMTKSIVFMQGNQIVVLPDGGLVSISAMLFRGSGLQPTPSQYFWAAMRSKDGGKTWGAPIKIAPLATALLTNPDIPSPTSFDETVRAGDFLPDVALDKTTGDIYVTFANDIGGGINHVMVTKSTDGGKRWASPVDITATPATSHSFNGTVEVTDVGVVAVMYYDFRNNTSAVGLPTDVWLTHSHDGGSTWSEQHVYGPFDMENAPVARGWFLGDYQGLAAIDDGSGNDDLMLFFSVSTSVDNSADVIAVRAMR
jgi:Neuraminidase (sialidase)